MNRAGGEANHRCPPGRLSLVHTSGLLNLGSVALGSAAPSESRRHYASLHPYPQHRAALVAAITHHPSLPPICRPPPAVRHARAPHPLLRLITSPSPARLPSPSLRPRPNECAIGPGRYCTNAFAAPPPPPCLFSSARRASSRPTTRCPQPHET